MGYITRFEPMTFVFVSNSLFTSQKCFCDRLPFARKNVCTLNVNVQSHLLNEMEWLQLKPACESLFFCLLSFSNFFLTLILHIILPLWLLHLFLFAFINLYPKFLKSRYFFHSKKFRSSMNRIRRKLILLEQKNVYIFHVKVDCIYKSRKGYKP